MSFSSNWADLERQLKKKVSETLQNEVFDTIRDVEVEKIDEEVYSVYTPRVYTRRGSSGGLSDKNNMKLNVVNDLTIEVTNETPANPKFGTTNKDLDELVEFGHGYNGNLYDYPRKGRAYMNPRPFTENTIEDLKQNGQHIDALKKGLRKRGIKTD